MSEETKRDEIDSTRRRALAIAAGAAVGATAMAVSSARAEGPAVSRSEFADKVLLITGATSGIGKGTAERFARYGAKVFFCGRRRNLGKEVEEAIRAQGGEATYMFADVREEDSVKAFVEACLERYGRIDIAFNNAGVEGDIRAKVATDTQGNWDDIFNTNTRGLWLSMKYEIPVMQNQGGGRIINMASLLGLRVIPHIPAYIASKHAVVGISHAAAAQHAGDSIRINVVAPGPTDTPLLAKVTGGDPDRIAAFNAGIPTGRIATVEDIAGGVELLASEAGSYLHGTLLVLDGGKSFREYGT